jgi:hypothetical protein
MVTVSKLARGCAPARRKNTSVQAAAPDVSGDIELRGIRISVHGSSDVHLKGNKVHTN